MGILDKVSSLLPWRRERSEPPPAHAQAFALREDLDHWLQGLLGEPRVFPAIPDLAWMPSADVRETDDEVVVTAEVPGLDSDDIDLAITPEGLLIRGEKEETKTEDRWGDRRVAECRYGSFFRVVPLPRGLDLDGADARVRNGVLTVRFPKVRGPRPAARRIPIGV